jgi:hypothetical protein
MRFRTALSVVYICLLCDVFLHNDLFGQVTPSIDTEVKTAEKRSPNSVHQTLKPGSLLLKPDSIKGYYVPEAMEYVVLLHGRSVLGQTDSIYTQKKYGNIEQEKLFSVRNIGIFTVIFGSVAGLMVLLNQVTEAPF